jgi:hypothetical protein
MVKGIETEENNVPVKFSIIEISYYDKKLEFNVYSLPGIFYAQKKLGFQILTY